MEHPPEHFRRGTRIGIKLLQNRPALLQTLGQKAVSDLRQQVATVGRNARTKFRPASQVLTDLAHEGGRVDGLGDIAVASGRASSCQLRWVGIGGERDDGRGVVDWM